MQNIAPKCL